MNTTCPDGWTNLSEFTILSTCSIPQIGQTVLKSIEISIGLLTFFIGLIMLVVRRKVIFDKAKYTVILIFCSLIQNFIMSLRPFLNLVTGLHSHSSLIMAYVTHISGIGAATVIILGVLLESRIIEKSSMTKHTSILAAKKEIVLSVIWIIQALMFLAGPLISYFFSVRHGIMFWSTVVMIDFTSIPYYCIMGTIIYFKVMEMQHQNFRTVSKRILITVILLGGVGLGTGIVGIYLTIKDEYEWIFTELCWIFNMIVNITIFIMLIKERVRR